MTTHWKNFLTQEFTQPYFANLRKFVDAAYRDGQCLPAKKDLFRAFSLCPKDQTRVVILGQDPYFQPGQANGLAFSVNPGVPLPPSLKNIFIELRNCYPQASFAHGDLSSWARQGVLLLNTALTVAPGQPASHSNCGWETFTDRVLLELARQHEFIIFVLWGRHAQTKKQLLAATPHHVIFESSHPSPLSATRSFFGSRVFQKINQTLEAHKLKLIDWELK